MDLRDFSIGRDTWLGSSSIHFSIQRVLRTVDGERREAPHLLQRDTACIRDRVSRRHERPTTTTTDAHVPMIYSEFAFLMNNKRRQGCSILFVESSWSRQNVSSGVNESPPLRNFLRRKERGRISE